MLNMVNNIGSKARIVLIISERDIETIRPIALCDAEAGPALALLDRISPAIEMIKALLGEPVNGLTEADPTG